MEFRLVFRMAGVVDNPLQPGKRYRAGSRKQRAKENETMSIQPFDPARYKAGQRWEWDTAAPRVKPWGPFLVQQLQPVSERMMELANIQPGQHIIAVATGGAAPALTAAHPLRPSAHLLA